MLTTDYTCLSGGVEGLWRAYLAHSMESKLCHQTKIIEQLKKNFSMHLSGNTEGMGMDS